MEKLYILQSEVGKLHETDNAETAMKLARAYALHHEKVIVKEYEYVGTFTVEKTTLKDEK